MMYLDCNRFRSLVDAYLERFENSVDRLNFVGRMNLELLSQYYRTQRG